MPIKIETKLVVNWNNRQNKWLHLTHCIGAPDENETARTRSHVIRSLSTRELIWSEGKESCCDVDNSLKRFWEIEKSGTDHDGRLVFTEEERLALGKVKAFLNYENGRYHVAVPWKENKPDLPDTKHGTLSPPKHRKKSEE
ncbi:unnamed protein product, partial [Pocillopora meandrina]